jgi:glutamate/tyrosine decarboxylase-like PLP-dependent enzyme
MRIPEQGVDAAALLERMQAMRGGDIQWKQHKAFGLVYHHSDSHTEIVKAAYNLFFSENALNPMAFKSLQMMEHDVVRMTAHLFHGDQDVAGAMTSGGTESLLLAVLAYRNRARKRRPFRTQPEIIVPESAHVAFIKAGEYFDVKIVRAPLQSDFRADVAAMEKRINRNTIALVGSAPCYPYGTVDPIEEIAALAQRHDLPFHVDGCLGGFLLPWVEKLGGAVPRFDFRVPGVTSISADLHKYGYAAKGASTILYRTMDYLRHQFFADVDWCGGVYASPTLAGTRPGGAIAAAWTSLQALGETGFMENARAVMAVARRYQEGINAIPELVVLGRPAMSVFAYGGRDRRVSAYAVGDCLERNAWHVDRLQKPESIHLILNRGHAAVADRYLADVRDAVAYVKGHPDAALEGSAPMYGLIAKAPLRRLVKRNVMAILEQMYSAEGGTPNLGNLPADETEGPGRTAAPVPKIVLSMMKLKARLDRLLRRT